MSKKSHASGQLDLQSVNPSAVRISNQIHQDVQNKHLIYHSALTYVFQMADRLMDEMAGDSISAGYIKGVASCIRSVAYQHVHDFDDSIEYEEEPSIRISLIRMFPDGLDSFEKGSQLLDVVASIIDSGNKVVLDFSGVKNPKSEFLDVSFGNLFFSFDRETIDKYLIMEGVQAKTAALITIIMNNAESYVKGMKKDE